MDTDLRPSEALSYCSTCGKALFHAREIGLSGGLTQDLCSTCSKVISTGRQDQVRALIDVFENPLLITDLDRRVTCVNLAGERALGDSMDSIIGSLAGDVIVCENASLPGGCGHTENCRACTIRNAVTTTLESQAEVTGAHAVQTVLRAGQRLEQIYAISTQRVGPRIIVQVVTEEKTS